MAGPLHLKIFLSSPGDLAEERQAIVRLVKDELPYDELIRGHATFDVLAWDDRAQRVALLAGLSGQASVDQALGTPSDCDLTVVVVRTRLGTPPEDRPRKADGTPCRSGTEWELWNALEAKKPVLVCRGPGERTLDLGNPDELEKQVEQARLVKEFFDDLAVRRIFVNSYRETSELVALVAGELKRMVRRRLEAMPGIAPAATAATAAARRAKNNLPPHNPDFVGREAVLAELRRLLTGGAGPAVLTQAITGLGGIGKTQTALAYAYRHLADYDLIWWLHAETPATLAADYVTLTGPLGLDLDLDTADKAKLVAAIRERLRSTLNWLVVFDNVEDPALPRAWLPTTTSSGHALITSRRSDWRGIAKPLPLEIMHEDEALRLLMSRPDPEALPAAELVEAKALAQGLGYLPLALAQARAYMHETGRDLAGYRKLLQDASPKILAKGRANPDYLVSVAKTWQISIDAAADVAAGGCAAARPLLELLAFFAPDALPLAVLASCPEALPEALRDELERDEAMAALNRFSLLRAEGGSITVHRLVQAMTRDGLKKTTAKARTETAIRLVKAGLPSPPWEAVHWPVMRALLPHALAVAAQAEQRAARLETAGEVLNEAGMYLGAQGTYAEAERLYRRAATTFEKISGPEHPGRGLSLSVLANLCFDTGRYAEAERLYRCAIAIAERTLEPRSRELGKRLYNFARLYWETKRYREAEPVAQLAIAIFEKDVEGPAHPDRAESLGSLAKLYWYAGRLAEAEPLYKRAIKVDQQDHGPEHVRAGAYMNDLADLYCATGRFAEAEPLYERALAIGEQVGGHEHPTLAKTMNSLAKLYFDTGRLAEAEPLYERALKIIEKSLPADHPDLAIVCENYAALLDTLGRGREAATLRARAEAIRQQREQPPPLSP